MTATDSTRNAFSLHIEYVDDAQQIIRDQRLSLADFDRAIHATAFDAFRHGKLESYRPTVEDAHVEPLFPTSGASSPRAMGFAVTISLGANREHRVEFELSFFRTFANRLRAELVRTEVMTGQQELYYRLNAFLKDSEEVKRTNKLSLSLGPPVSTINVSEGPRPPRGKSEAWDAPCESDLPVTVEYQVITQALEEARENPSREIAGFLLGHVMRDQESGDLIAAVTGLASADSTTESTAASVTYTPASFAQARDIAQLRASGESIIGWYHSHPFQLCNKCPLPPPPECVAKVLFYSQDDMHLMETTFAHPFMVGLLVAVEPRIESAVGHLPVKMYGWRKGEIHERGFEVTQIATP